MPPFQMYVFKLALMCEVVKEFILWMDGRFCMNKRIGKLAFQIWFAQRMSERTSEWTKKYMLAAIPPQSGI